MKGYIINSNINNSITVKDRDVLVCHQQKPHIQHNFSNVTNSYYTFSENIQFKQHDGELIEMFIKEDKESIPDSQEPIFLVNCLFYLKNKQHIWCQHYTICEKLFEYTNFKYLLDGGYYPILKNQLSTCIDCVFQYCISKRRELKKLLLEYNNIESIEQIIHKNDSERILECLESSLCSNDLNKLLISITEVLFYPSLLKNQTLKRKVFNILQDSKLKSLIKNIVSDCRCPGVYVLFMCRFNSLKEWVYGCINENEENNGEKRITVENFGPLRPVFSSLVDSISQHQSSQVISNSILSNNIGDVFTGIPFLIYKFTKDALVRFLIENPSFIRILFTELKNSNNREIIGLVFRAIEIIYYAIQQDIWENIEDFNSLIYLQIILNSNFYANEYQFSLVIQLKYSLMCYCYQDLQSLKEVVSNFIFGLIVNDFRMLPNQVKLYCIRYYIDSIYPSKQFNLIGRNLIEFVVFNIYQYEIAQEDYGFYIKFLKNSLLDSIIEIRNLYQIVLNSKSKEGVIKALKNELEFWPSSVWKLLLLSDPSKVPNEIHQAIFNLYQLLSLVDIGHFLKSNDHLKSHLFKSLEEYQNLVYNYLLNFSTQLIGSGDLFNCSQFNSSIFSFLVSPSLDICESFKKLLINKFPAALFAETFQRALLRNPKEVIKGVTFIIRDLILNYGIINCIERINQVFYYCNTIVWLFKSNESLSPLLLEPLIDIVWPVIEYVLSRCKNINSSSPNNIDKLKYMFIFLKDSFAYISSFTYCSIESPKASFFLLVDHNDGFMFSSFQQYPEYIRESLKLDQNPNMQSFKIPSERSQFIKSIKFLSDDTLVSRESTKSIITNYIKWINNMFTYKYLGGNSEWFDALYSILKRLINKKYINITSLDILKDLKNYHLDQFISIINSVQESVNENNNNK